MHDRPHYPHAQKVVDNFRRVLGEELCNSIGDYHFSTLEVLIESAINTSVMAAMQLAEKDVEELLKKLRNHTHR